MAIITDANIPTTGIGGPSPAPDYTPPSIIWKDADEVYVPKGRYYKAGYRFGGQYQDLSNLSAYWDVADRFAVDIDATYSAGSTSGMLGGDVASSWYSVFMVDSDEILLLPFIRVDAITYSAPSTTINPAAHADGTTAENGFVTANDIFNTYRLVLLNDDPTESGNVYTIADCATGTPDTIVITGDVTGQIAATEWLQMIPPDGTDCLYLGSLYFKSDGSMRWFRKSGWRYLLGGETQTMIKNTAANRGNSDMGATVTPCAVSFSGYAVFTQANARGFVMRLYYGSSGSDTYETYKYQAGVNLGTMNWVEVLRDVEISSTALIRNHMAYYDTSDVETAIGTGYLQINGMAE